VLKPRTRAADRPDAVRTRERRDAIGELAEARQRISELEAKLAELESRDPITRSLLTLKAFRAQLELDVRRAQRYHRPLSVALIDIDGFRAINLKHGYTGGDAVLASFGRLLGEATRVHDLACRLGGDEFALLLPETTSLAAVQTMERLLFSLEDLDAGPVRGVSISIGVASLEAKQTPERLLATAGEALQQARARGGGQVSMLAGNLGNGGGDPVHGEVVAALASALQERDRYTGEHSESVVEMAARVAQSMGLDAEEVSRVRTAALLHDIGKVGIPDEILHKPGPLDEREWELMRQHPAIGERILRAIPGLRGVARIVRHEHERWDGDGYPDGLKGEETPVGSRIILACDAYHAMTSDRPYRKAMAHSEAMEELTRNAGTQFDPQVVQELVGYLYGRRQAGAPS
jgi:diguanylate cyclase (GGDEF)-like protein/putative nucleotidyltransferase with HDIG domain